MMLRICTWLTILLVGTPVGAGPAIPRNEPGHSGSAELADLLGQSWSEILHGKFSQAQSQMEQAAAAAPGDGGVERLGGWLRDYCQLAAQREQLRRSRYDKLAEEARSLAGKGRWGEFAKTMVTAFWSAASPEQFRAEPWVRQVLQEAAAHGEELHRRGEWLEAATIFASLREIFPDEQRYEDQLRTCTKHARVLAMYTRENEPQWRQGLQGARVEIVGQVLDQISLNYVREPDFKKVAAGGLENLLVLAQTPQAAEVFENLGRPELVGEFVGQIESMRARLDRASFVTSRVVYQWLGELLELNERTLKLPRELVVVEFMEGALEPLDEFSSMIWPSELSEFKKHTTGQFSGVGIQISLENNQLTVVSPLEDTPAYEAGIQPGDVIVAIDGKSTEGITLTRAVQTITGPPGTQVMLTIKRRGEGKTAEVPLTRATITIQTVKGYARKDGHWDYMMDPDTRIAYIRLTSFMERTTQELEQALQRIAEEKARGLIVDLRFNTGGLLRTAVEVADLFLPSGQVIVSTKGRNSPGWSQPANGSEANPGLDLIVLVNKYSASASEILAGAIQDNHRGLVIGQRSYGKGSVQNLIPVGDGSAYLKLTTALYYLPSGRCIDRQNNHELWGVDPDIPVNLIPEETQKVLELRRKSDVVNGKLVPLRGEAGGQEPGALDFPSVEEPPATTEAADDVPDVDPALETALLVMRFKLTSGLAWQPEPIGPASARAASQTN